MGQYAGIDVSLEPSSVCIVDAQGKIVKETKRANRRLYLAFSRRLALLWIGSAWRQDHCRSAFPAEPRRILLVSTPHAAQCVPTLPDP